MPHTVPGRFEFVFTPTPGSWLNMVEGFFSKFTKQMLTGIKVSGKEDISQIVYEVVNHKAANTCDKDKRAPKSRTRKCQGPDKQE